MDKSFPRFLKWWESRKARNFFNNVFKNEILKDLKKCGFNAELKLVGSIKRNTCLVFEDKKFDVDYQIIIKDKSHDQIYATEVEKHLFKLITSIRDTYNSSNNNCELKVEDSTSAYTIKRKCKKAEYSYDVAIISSDEFIIRRDKKNNNEYVWEKLKYGELYEKWKTYRNNYEKIKILDIFLKKKIENRNSNNQNKKHSSSLLLEAINEYEQEKNKR